MAAFDRERYRTEVLDPARKAKEPPQDLLTRYGFAGTLPGQPEFTAQVEAVRKYWQSLENKTIWRGLVNALLNQHERLDKERKLTPDAFRAQRAQHQAEAVRRLKELVKDQNDTHVGPAVVAQLRAAAGSGLSDADVRAALSAVGTKVVDKLPELPPAPPPDYDKLVPELRALELRLSADAVFEPAPVRAGFRLLGGFRLASGSELNDAAVAERGRQCAAWPHNDPRKKSIETVLAIVRRAIKGGSLNQLLLWEVIAQQRARIGLGQRAMAREGASLGLDADEAGLLAAALVAGGSAANARQQIEEDLAAGRLRAAEAAASQLQAGDELRARVSEKAAAVADLVARAGTELAAGRDEAAAQLLDQAVAQAADDDSLAERLGQISPPPPGGAKAVVDGDKVVVSWQASPARAGLVHYRVSRGTGRAPGSPGEGQEITASTEALYAADPAPPAGADLCYAVFASRGGPHWSAPAATAAVTIAPDVSAVHVEVTADAATVTWRMPAGARQVRVERTAVGRRSSVPAELTRFTDTGLTPGTEYTYRITAVYRGPDGSDRGSGGVTVSASPAHAPVPVGELAVQAGLSAVEVSWAPPPHGRVELLISQTPPRWPAGTEPGEAALAAFGRPVTGTPRPDGSGRVTLSLPAPSGRRYLLAVTKVGRRAVAGARAELGLAEPVRELVARRLVGTDGPDQAELSWVWPEGAVSSIITWPGGQRRCTLRAYADDGGVLLPVGQDAEDIQVSAVHPDIVAELVSLPVAVTVAGRKASVRYRWLKAGPTRRSRRVLELTTDRSCQLPELVVVRSTEPYPPDDAAEGIEVTRLPPAAITPAAPLKIPVDLPGKAAGFLACFTAGDNSGVLLFPPPPNEMRIR
jgi:hypothetical protein